MQYIMGHLRDALCTSTGPSGTLRHANELSALGSSPSNGAGAARKPRRQWTLFCHF